MSKQDLADGAVAGCLAVALDALNRAIELIRNARNNAVPTTVSHIEIAEPRNIIQSITKKLGSQ